jgi:hypothetical protein
MDRRTLILILSIVAVMSIAYAIYRSLPERITTVENGHEVVYGDPQHGLILGLLLLAGICISGIVYLASLAHTNRSVEKPVQTFRTEQAITSSGSTSSYRPLS